ncbi:MAG: hypothetical protein R3Y22_06680 [Bacteroidales bacterium]
MRNRLGALLMAIAMVCTVANAQNSKLNKEIVVETSFQPTETDADKLNLTPNEVEITISEKKLDYSNWAVPTTVQPTLQTLAPIEYAAKQISSDQRGYLQLGAGTYLNSNTALGYRVIDDTERKLNIWGEHTSTWLGHNTSPYVIATNGETPTQEFNNALLGMSYTQLLSGNKLFKADAYYHFDRFNYYGSSDGLDMQMVNEFNIDLSLRNDKNGTALNYWGGLEYNYWGNSVINEISENQIKVNGGAETAINNFGSLGITGEIGYTFYNKELPILNDTLSVSNIFRIELTPAYKYNTNQLALQLGARIDYTSDTKGNLHISPAVKLDYQFNSKIGAYVYLLGGERVNSYAALSAQNRYFAPSLYYGTSDSPLDATLGAKFAPFEGFKGVVSAGYLIVDNQMLPYYNGTTDMTIYSGVDMSGWMVSADLEYSYKTLGSVKVAAKYAPQNGIDKGYVTQDDRAELVINAEITSTPIDKLRATIGYEYRGNRAVWGYNSSAEVISADLGDMNNLYLNASYDINNKFSIYTNISNILYQQWDNYYGMGAQKLGAVVGVSILF